MQIIFLIIASLLPIVALLWYFERQDRGRKEPLRLKWKVFKWGLIVTLVAAVIEINIDTGISKLITNHFAYIAFTSFVTAAIIEEGAKLWVVKKFVYYNKHFNEHMDGITYTIIASLGFAALENVLYVLEGGFSVAIVRALLSVPAHAMFSGIMGYYIGKAKFTNNTLFFSQSKLVWIGYALAVLYHGLFNFFILSQTAMMILVVPLLIIMAVHLKHLIRKARFADHVTKTKPENLTIWRILRILLASILILFGAASIMGSILLSQDPSSGYTQSDILYSILLALILFVPSYFLIRRGHGDKTRKQQ